MTTEWLPHDGGPCPVAPETMVATRFRDGDEDPRTAAGFWSGIADGDDWWQWRADSDDPCSIVAYRVIL